MSALIIMPEREKAIQCNAFSSKDCLTVIMAWHLFVLWVELTQTEEVMIIGP